VPFLGISVTFLKIHRPDDGCNSNRNTYVAIFVALCILICAVVTHHQMHIFILKNTLQFTLKYT